MGSIWNEEPATGGTAEWHLYEWRAELTAQCCWVSPKALALVGTERQTFRSEGLPKAQSYVHGKSLFYVEDLMAVSGFDNP